MARDELAPEAWLGDVYSDYVTPTSTPQRFCSVSLRFKSVKIQIMNANYHAYIGKYNSTIATFEAGALRAQAESILELEYIDLHELGFNKSDTGSPTIKVLGMNEY